MFLKSLSVLSHRLLYLALSKCSSNTWVYPMFLKSLSLCKCSSNPWVYYPLAYYPGFIQMFPKSLSLLSPSLVFLGWSNTCRWSSGAAGVCGPCLDRPPRPPRNPWVYYLLTYYPWVYYPLAYYPGFIQIFLKSLSLFFLILLSWLYPNVPEIPEFIIP